MTLRVAVGDPRTASATFPAVATGSVTVSVRSSLSGTTTGPFTAVQSGATATYTHQLTAADVSEVDLLTVTFTGTVAGIQRSYREHVQVCGDYYFTVEELRALPDISVTISDADIEEVRTAVEDQIEVNCDTAFVGRYVHQRVSGYGEPFIRLDEAYVNRVLGVTEDDVDVLADVDPDGRFLWRDDARTAWATGHRNISVHYEHCYQEYPPEDLRTAAKEAARHQLMRQTHTGTPQAVTSITTDMGAMRIAVAGLRQPFGLPEVDAVVLRWSKAVGSIL